MTVDDTDGLGADHRRVAGDINRSRYAGVRLR
jgi:hypothetical protein